MAKLLLAAAAALTTFSAAAQEPLPRIENQVFVSGCRQGECSWVRVLRLTRVSRVPQGELRRIEARNGYSLDPGGDGPVSERRARIVWNGETRTDHVFCSTARPAYTFEAEQSDRITHYLDLFELAGYQEGSASLYMRACHGRALTPEQLRRLGYRPGTRNEQTEGGRPEDLTRF